MAILSLLFGEGLPPLPDNLWRAWSWEPGVLLALVLAAWLYLRGMRTLWQRAGSGRVVRLWQVASFGGGLAALFIALISPLNTFSGALFSAHMIQHLLLFLAAAPLLALGAPLVPWLWALPRPVRYAVGRGWRQAGAVRALWRGLTHPLVVWVLHTLALWLWHLPGLYQAALERAVVHELEHATFLGTALLFWWVLFDGGGRRRLSDGAGILYLFTAALQSGALGALLTFARTPLYPIYTSSAAAWNLTVLEDQQLAGVIMWVPAGVVYLVAALILLGRWLAAMEQLPPPLQATAEVGRTSEQG